MPPTISLFFQHSTECATPILCKLKKCFSIVSFIHVSALFSVAHLLITFWKSELTEILKGFFLINLEKDFET